MGILLLSARRLSLLASACLLPLLGQGQALAQAAAPAAQAPGAVQGFVPPASSGPPAPVHRRVPRARPARRAIAASVPLGGTIRDVRIMGNQRIEPPTILSYMLVQAGDPFDAERIDRSLRTLYSTGLFHDVNFTREGDTLVVHVVENPIVNTITFEGNHTIEDADLRKIVTLRPRAVFTPRMAQLDRDHILAAYTSKGHYAATIDPQIVRLPQNRVNVIYNIHDGAETQISRISFVGNHAFSEGTLRGVVSSREERFWRLFSSADEYDPERIRFDRELLRRFYLAHGFADVDVTGAVAELTPDRKSFFISFTINEGERYRVGTIKIVSKVPKANVPRLQALIELQPRDFYNGDAVERSSTAMSERLLHDGLPFAHVEPRISRNKAQHTVDLVFEVTPGERLYVEQIDIFGNTVTQDRVIRREFQFAEGDPFNQAAVKRTKQRLDDLGYFEKVTINPQPGSSADKVNVSTEIDEKATGEFTLGGGYSTDAGILGQIGLRQKNLVGSGIDAGINGVIAQRESQVDLSATDPYFLDRNLVAGFDIFETENNNLYIADYEEQREGITLRLGYAFNDHLSQALNYQISDRDVHNIATGASLYINDESGYSLLSQVGQTFSIDYRDSRVDPHTGFITRIGTDFAGLGGNEHYVRVKVDNTVFIPLDRFTGNSDWGFAISAGAGYLDELGNSRERIIDRFFLGGDNLRGFQDGGAGPHSIATDKYPSFDSLGGEFIYTQSTELHFPLPISADLGITGRAFVDVGGLGGLIVPNSIKAVQGIYGQDDLSPRVGAGVGISWRSPFGLINVDLADPVVKHQHDQTQIFRFGFGTRF